MKENEAKEKQGELLEGRARLSEGTKISIQNLLTVKSLVTILLTFVFGWLALKGRITGEQFLTIFSVVIAFYFGTQYEKGKGGGEE